MTLIVISNRSCRAKQHIKYPDKGKTKSKDKVLPVPVKGNLSKYGYSNVKNTKAAVRRAALLKGVKDVHPCNITAHNFVNTGVRKIATKGI